jgi:hypothetical protein
MGTRLDEHERSAVRARLAQIDVAIGHPKLTIQQVAALRRERTSLESVLAAE